MAVSRNGNVIFADATGTVTGRFLLVGAIIVATSGNASIILQDNGETKFRYDVSTSRDSAYLDLNATPIRFDTNIDVTTATNVAATLIIRPVGT